MRILVIGGTSFVGRAIVEQAIDSGHDVTLFNRGRTNPDVFPDAEHLTGDRDSDLSALAGREWDATIDVCAYVPAQVRTLLSTLGERAGHYTFISTISVYGQVGVDAGFTEDAPLLEPAWDDQLTMEKYGELKVGCELAAHEAVGDRLLIIRPGYVIGPYDKTMRFPHWIEVVAAGESPLIAPDAEQPLQAVDARDLAAFTVAQTERLTVDVFHVTAPDPAPTFAEVLQTIADALDKPLPKVDWVGARDDLPLSAPPDWWPKMRASMAKARAAGLTWRPLSETVQDTYAWMKTQATGQ